ncbi:tRNA (cytidine(32)/guanosine(34)-2'-o)-methyltransferase-related [Anaeramoeba flamelloides]|uniref:Putative tRNA (cytidine(32)/guanosine(34)-2'-O)-methyltransferase n=1 Tax=Anaeramoeba flamelloides TaxID=1746091 RepID=A0AAV7Z2S4_9EUKA|nr:tRNA (cytidine(32)/guanosine(34)-2'-o)-methyltransferase-related [Anaeramoeba flamelloides]KAJ6231009.1 tRNA (cytidine(32)/guanosine(34)-2'-o)-methyltransferase-related [Anaeramoeba flamelloides]
MIQYSKKKDRGDSFYRRAKEEGYRARSAFKLLQIDEEYNLFKNGKINKIVDLCAAPGSWSQVISKKVYQSQPNEKLREKVTIVAVDIQPMAPIEGVVQLQGDITLQSTATKIVELCGGEHVDLVVSDGAPDVTGLHDLDVYAQAQLVKAALNISLQILKREGDFVAKVFMGTDLALLENQLSLFFEKVSLLKPKSSRNKSREAFFVCQNFQPHKEFSSSMDLILGKSQDWDQLDGINRIIVPFLNSGDLSAFDNFGSLVCKHDKSLEKIENKSKKKENQTIEKKN